MLIGSYDMGLLRRVDAGQPHLVLVPLGVQNRHRVALGDRHRPAPQIGRMDAGREAQDYKQEVFHDLSI